MLAPMFPWSDPPEALRFDRFMAAALHDPQRGYYARRIRSVGHRGDFTTAASLSPALGRAVGAWAAEALRETRCRDLIELGPGTGVLSAAVLASLPFLRRRRTRLHLVERSEPLRAQQRERLGDRVRWHDTAASALAACDGQACLFSNEFVDAFPARRFRRTDRGWAESWVLPGKELWRETDELPASSVFDRTWPPGQIVEVHDSFHRWLDEDLAAWTRGRMLTIDYGAEVDDLYHRRPDGSLRGYFHQQLITGAECLARPGHQDLTCDVNFTDLGAWSGKLARRRRLITQSDFLDGHVDPGNPADRFASHPSGAGGGFLVLETECPA